MCDRLVWYIVISALEESVALIFSPEDGRIRFLRNFGNDLE
jgi:hypothetical protein